MRYHVNNGTFNGNSSGWTTNGTAAYLASAGSVVLGCASMPAGGDYIEQQIALPRGAEYVVDVWAVGVSVSGNVDVAIINSDGVTVWSATLSVLTSWANVHGQRIGLPAGTFTLRITYNDVAIYVDRISVAQIVKTRAELAQLAANMLGILATDASYKLDASDLGSEGHYTDAIDSALREYDAIGPDGVPDVRCIDVDMLDAVIDSIRTQMLHKLHAYYAHAIDFTLEGRTEHLTQRTAAIEKLLGLAVGGRSAATGRAPQQSRLRYKR